MDRAVADLDEEPIWRGEGERGPDLVVRVTEDQRVAVNFLAEPAADALYVEHLRGSGLDESDQRAVRAHRSHGRCSFMDTDAVVEPSDRMGAVYKVAARLSAMDGIAVLAPESGVFALGLRPEHVDGRLEQGVPPLDLWIQVEMTGEDRARSVGAPAAGALDVELVGVTGMSPDEVFDSVLGAVAYMERIRRELIPGETLHIGSQPFRWIALKGKKDLVVLQREEGSEEG